MFSNKKPKINLTLLFYLTFILTINISHSSPLSSCSEGTFSYIKDSSINSNQCGLSTEIRDTYPAAVNSAFFDSSAKCGICYEMVGPFGAVKIRIEDSTDDSNSDDESIPHFKVGKEATFTLLGTKDSNYLNKNKKISVSLRMISCDYSDKIKILTSEDNNDNTFSFLILNSNIAVSSTSFRENEGSNFLKLKRDTDNYWFYEKGNYISYPIEVSITAITGEVVNITLNSKESDKTYETNGNFNNPEKFYYTIDTLEKEEDIEETEKCCSVDFSSFAPIYSDGNLNKNYAQENNNIIINSTSDNMDINFLNYGKLIIKSWMPIRADQFLSLSLTMNSDKICKDCLYISSYGKNADVKIQIQKANTFKNYQYDFDSLGIEENTFNGIVIYTKDSSINVTINNIELVENSNAPSAEICVGDKSSWIPSSSKPEINITETNINIITTNYYSFDENNNTNNTEIIEINIKNISSINSTFILVECESFKIVNNETLNLKFANNINQFNTKACFLDYSLNYTQSFNCEIENISNIPNGEYKVQTHENNIYHINRAKNITIENGIIFYDFTPTIIPIVFPSQSNLITTDIINDMNFTVPINSNKIVITNSINKEVNKDIYITFQIEPIESRNYNNISQIIFIDNDSQNKNALYFKNCQAYSRDGEINSILCKVSNNMIKGTYTTLANGQNIELAEGVTVSLIISNSTGGILSQDKEQVINVNIISRRQKRNFTLDFNVLYYDHNLKPGDLFPYAVNLSGTRKISIFRGLQYIENRNVQIQFPNCTMGNYSNSTQNEDAIEGITCQLPDFVPAGIYTKLTSDGFDINPNNKISVNFPYDFNKSQGYITEGDEVIDNYRREDSSSSSKTWVIWVILGILVVVLAVVIILAFCCNRKKNMIDANNSNVSNDSGTNEINNSNNYNFDKDNNKNDNKVENNMNNNNENNKSNNSMSQSQSS